MSVSRNESFECTYKYFSCEITYKFEVDLKCRRLRKEGSDEYQTKIKQVIKKANRIIDPKETYALTLINPYAPPMIAMPKIHKPGTPKRPKINQKSEPSYKLSKHPKTILNINIDNNVYKCL